MPAVPITPDTGPSVVLELLYRLKVRDAMSSPVITATPRDSLRAIQYRMRDNGITGVPIVEGDSGRGMERLVGLVSIGDIIGALDKGSIEEPAESAMTRGVIVLEDDMPLAFATTYFDRYRFRRFPVLDRSGRLVGLLSASDVVRLLLVRMNEEVARLEASLAERQAAGSAAKGAAAGAAADVERLAFPIARIDFEHAGTASAALKRLLKARGVDPAIARRAAVASYELELNVVIHSEGGSIAFEVGGGRIVIVAEDQGPGIPDVEAAMREGFSTANEWIRSLGFGAGMGLPNARRVADEFSMESSVGGGAGRRGTRVRCVITYP